MSVQHVQSVITAAGDSRPLFLPSGFGSPKGLVLWHDQEVIINALESYVINLERACVAVHKEEDTEWGISSVISRKFPAVRIVKIRPGTLGALASALVAMEGVDPDAPLVVAAGDSVVKGGMSGQIEKFQAMNVDAATIAFQSQNPRWSYLSVDPYGAVRQVQEKRVIGPLATTGVFYFRTARQFLSAAQWVLVNNAMNNGVYYVSTTLNYMISQGLNVYYSTIPRDQYASFSLPSDFRPERTDSLD
jgi:dTDP-glucose pyrophosphorylase